MDARIPSGIGVRLDHCWICGNKLLDSGGDSNFLRHQHHVIPSAAGGYDGPQVSLDSSHHNLLHSVAARMMSAGGGWEQLVQSMKPDHRQRLLYLSTRVVEAFKYAENDPNKRITVNLSVSTAENAAIKKLADFHGMSKDRLLRKLLADEYRLRFQPGK